MKSMIEELWYGNLSFCENCGVGDTEIERVVLLMAQNEKILCKELEVRQKALFEEYAKWSDKYACYVSACAFREGFCLATKLMREALAES